MHRCQHSARLIFTFFVATQVGGIASGAVPLTYRPDYDRGHDVGYEIGYESGFAAGEKRGKTEGGEKGDEDGFSLGWNESYQPAYDRAYAVRFPIARDEGWADGVEQGYEEGLDWAPVVAQQLGIQSATTIAANISYFTLSDVIFSKDPTTAATNSNPFASFHAFVGWYPFMGTLSDFMLERDWAAHYYDLGYGDGHKLGLSVGSDQGYDLAYPIAYEAAFKKAHGHGLAQGKWEGTVSGGSDADTDGWQVGWDSGYDFGFEVGVWGGISQPGESLRQYLPARWPYGGNPTADLMSAVPEPTGFVLLATAIGSGLVVRRRRA